MKRVLIRLWILVFVADSLIHPLLWNVEYVIIQRNLTTLEEQLSKEKANQIGESQAIIVLEDNDRKRGDVYSQNFFAEEHNGKTVCYTIVDSAQLIDFQKVSKQTTNDPFSSDNHNVFLKIQKDLFFQNLSYLAMRTVVFEDSLQLFYYINPRTETSLIIPTPPPNTIIA